MREFLRENWVWIVAPIGLVLALLALMLLCSDRGEAPNGIYHIF